MVAMKYICCSNFGFVDNLTDTLFSFKLTRICSLFLKSMSLFDADKHTFLRIKFKKSLRIFKTE